MKRTAIIVALALASLPALAQNHGEVGVYADYFGLQVTEQNLYGVGGRLSVNAHANVALEGEMNYDFEQSQTSVFTSGSTTQTIRTSLRLLHGLFGPKLQVGGDSPVRVFGTIKGWFPAL